MKSVSSHVVALLDRSYGSPIGEEVRLLVEADDRALDVEVERREKVVEALRLGFGVREMMVVMSGEIALSRLLAGIAGVDFDRGLALRVGVIFLNEWVDVLFDE